MGKLFHSANYNDPKVAMRSFEVLEDRNGRLKLIRKNKTAQKLRNEALKKQNKTK